LTSFLAGNLGVRASDIDIVGFHGQTISHRPEQRFTWQIGDASWLAREVGVPVVADFRTADVAAGGQGAPLVPVYHRALVEQARHNATWRLPVAVLNIGGVANVTWIGEGGELLAFDTGPGNAPLDDWVRRHGLGTFDADGHLSASGTADWSRIRRVLSSSYFSEKPPKSLDRNDFISAIADNLSVQDGAATLASLCAAAASEGIRFMPERPTRWIVCGGGARNRFTMSMLESLSKVLVEVDVPGWNGFALEAQAFGFLAVRSLRGLPLTFPATTGVPLPLSGGRLFPA
jgi:anhydro-N-acetylmuramic acid kinase